MSDSMKIKIRENNGQAKVLVLINHPMENGQRIGKDGRKISAHYIDTIDFALNGKPAAQALLGPGVSRNPLVGIMLRRVKTGDRVTVKWVDNKDQTGSAVASVA